MIAADIIVVGGGIVGSTIGFGLAKVGESVLVLDGDDKDREPLRRSNYLRQSFAKFRCFSSQAL